MKRLFKIVAWTVAALVSLIVIAAIVIPLVFDPNDYRDEIGALVKRTTGRELVIEGDLELSFFPWLGVEAGATRLSNAPGFGATPFASFDHAKVHLRLLPLLRRKVELDTVELANLRLNLARDGAGRTNWDDLVQSAEKEPPTPEEPQEEGGGLAGLRLGGVELSDAQVTWSDAMAGREATLSHLNLTTGEIDPREPLELDFNTEFAVDAPQAAGRLALKATLHHDMEAQQYRVEGLAMDLSARGNAVPGRTMTLTLRGDAQADLKAQTASADKLRLETFGAELQTSLTATQILDKPDARGTLDLQVKDSKTLVTAIAAYLPASVQLDHDSLASARLAAPFEVSLGRGTATLPEVRAMVLGGALGARIEASRLLDKPAARGALRLEVKDGQKFLAPFSASLPKGFSQRELSGAVVESGFSADLASGEFALSDARLNAMGLRVTAEARGRGLDTRPAVDGSLQVDEFVPRDLAAKVGVPLPKTADGTAFSKASLSTRFEASGQGAGLRDLVLRLDESTLKGRLAAERFTPLKLRYDLTLDRIDADRYLPPATEEQPPAATAAATAPLQLPLEQLRALDIDGTLRVGDLKAANLRSTAILATLRANDGLVRIQPASAKLYGGTYNGNLGLDVRGKTPQLSMDEKLQGVQVGPLLKDFMGKDYVSGTAQLSAKLTARGTAAMQIRQTLNGTAGFNIEDGAVNGFNLAQILREGYAKFKGESVQKGEVRKTDFAELRGTVTVTDGLVANNDLTARSPLLRVAGKGTAHLVTEKIDYRVNTTLVGSLEGQGAQDLAQLKGITLPVLIAGTFSEPKFSVDVGAALAGKATEALEAQKKKLQEQIEAERKKKEQELQQQIQDKLKGLLKSKP